MSNANRDKGIKAERDVVRDLAPFDIDAIRLGEQTARRGSTADRGDIHIGPICVQVKDWTKSNPKGLRPAALITVLADAAAQCRAADLDVWFVIEKRPGYSNAVDWWVWMTHRNYLRLTAPGPHCAFAAHYPIRVRLAELVVPIRLAVLRGHVA